MSNLREQHNKDLDGILDKKFGFAQVAEYASGIDGLKDINIIFEPEHTAPHPYTAEYEVIPPMATAKTSDVPNIAHKDTLKINDVIYEVLVPRANRTGLTIIELGEKA